MKNEAIHENAPQSYVAKLRCELAQHKKVTTSSHDYQQEKKKGKGESD